MTFYVKFDNASIGIVDPLKIGSFSFMASIFNVYAGAKILLKDFAREHNNDVKTGMNVDVHFVDEEKSQDYVVPMAVLSYKKVPGPSTTDYIDVTLVSRAYFHNELVTSAHSGTVSQITYSIFKDRLSKEFNSLVLEDTQDTDRIRYQLGERDVDFLDRITKYGYIDNKPVYLFSDPLGNLNLKGISSMEDSTPKFTITPLTFLQGGQKASSSNTAPTLIPLEMFFNGGSKGSVSECSSVFNNVMFVSPSGYTSSVNSKDSEEGNAQSEVASPKKVEFYGWNLSPEDSLGISVRRNFERNADVYTFEAVFDSFLINQLPLGSVSYVILPFEPTARSSNGSEVNAGEGKYLVSQVKFVYEDSLLRTSVKMIQVGF